ncbi:MAG: hypothetical protein KGI58_03095 [Patescibacteria group bacterium]|nr:hypothetical protein [Patescibacteria group bacterium]
MTETTTSRFTSSLILINKNEEIALQPSKAGRRKENQFDLPSSSKDFGSFEECMNHFNRLIGFEKYPRKLFERYFKISKKPINFSHFDALGEKYFLGYLVVVKHKSMVHTFMQSVNGIFLPKDYILERNTETTDCFITNLFREAINEAFISKNEFLNSFFESNQNVA